MRKCVICAGVSDLDHVEVFYQPTWHLNSHTSYSHYFCLFPCQISAGRPFDGERRLPVEIEKNLKAAYHLDKPLSEQFFLYCKNLIKGDLGPSFRQKDFSVSQLIASGLPISVLLGFLALLLALSIGCSVGIFCGANQGHPVDRLLMSVNNLNLAVPSIVSSPILILIFASPYLGFQRRRAVFSALYPTGDRSRFAL